LRRSISIIVPAFNEASRLPGTLDKVRAYLDRSAWDFAEILVVDDGSRDGTAQAARAAGARVLENPGNRGKGYSVRRGMLDAKGEWALFTDADLSAPIEDMEKLWAATASGSVRIAVGSRAVDRSLVGVHQPIFREAVGRIFNLAMRAITGLPYRDTRAAREIFSRQRLDGFGFDVEVLFIARRLGYAAAEVPVRWNNVAGTTVSLWRGVMAFLDPVKVRWNGFLGRYR
jgi:glycosyltransferase involved in cell wall biosynthesis